MKDPEANNVPCIKGSRLKVDHLIFKTSLVKSNKMEKPTIIFGILLVVLVAFSQQLEVGCPVSSKLTSCSPKCKDDTECFGQKCCPNICNMKSCTPANLNLNTKDGYKNQNSKSGTGSYCGNVKCNSYEKCEIERSTKRQRCVRS